ncbi:MAG: Tm-1-like ATP-binding domain-containing protein, partial [Planctomycetales bacterium]|nr:Tm-1-like ATP-binding domain-containing protein [Planctomycetales bacterium]
EAAKGAAKIVRDAFAAGKVSGVLALGGSAGTAIGTAAMRELPIGIPKLMVSTLASGQVRQYVGDKDILMLNSVVDIAGINRVSRNILGEAAAAMAGMVKFGIRETASELADDKPLIAATMFGVTTPCVQRARQVLEEAGYEVLVFHATGNGGQAMESLIRDGLIAGVLDITTTELADELVGGVLSAGPDRLTAAGKRGVPQVVSVGALDMVNFGPAATVPEKFKARKFHVHNPSVTLMRTTPEARSPPPPAPPASCCRCKESPPSTAPASPSTTPPRAPPSTTAFAGHMGRSSWWRWTAISMMSRLP